MKTTTTRAKHHGRERSLQVRLPESLRSEADAVLAKIGLDMPTAVRIYINKIVQTRSIPFALEAPDIKVEAVEVDAETQRKMNEIASVWKKSKA